MRVWPYLDANHATWYDRWVITEAQGSLFDTGAVALVNPVNCVGVMGAGLALQFKRRFPSNFAAYQDDCRSGILHPGRVTLFREAGCWIVNFPTKDHWRDPSRLEWVESGLAYLRKVLDLDRIRSVAVPALGCGLGGLKWPDVKQAIEGALGDGSFETFVYPPATA